MIGGEISWFLASVDIDQHLKSDQPLTTLKSDPLLLTENDPDLKFVTLKSAFHKAAMPT